VSLLARPSRLGLSEEYASLRGIHCLNGSGGWFRFLLRPLWDLSGGLDVWLLWRDRMLLLGLDGWIMDEVLRGGPKRKPCMSIDSGSIGIAHFGFGSVLSGLTGLLSVVSCAFSKVHYIHWAVPL